MDAVETVKRQIDLVEYIGRFTKLTRAGRHYRGLCPFHSEKTPSFYVFPERGTWRCFGACGEGGDLFTFVQKLEGVDFRTALRQLAEEAGVRLQDDDPRRRSRLERLAAVMSAAVGFYERQLREPAGQPALEYLTAGRGLTPETIAAWHLGWAPEGWRHLRDFLANRGYTEEDLLAAGLLVEPEAGRESYDRFRGRVIIPIANERGEFVAMGGRGLHGEEPKYLNSPQTELFDKGRTLFGLHLAGEAIRARGEVVVVEGYMDVLGPWQAGYHNVVATMGTSLTHEHAALLRRYARRIVLALDPDSAGLAAAERAGGLLLGLATDEQIVSAARAADELAAAAEIDLRVAVLPPGRDPDELVREAPGLWEQAIASARPFAEFLVDRMMGAARPASPLEARHTVDRLRPLLLAVRDPVERAVYVQRVARHLGVEEEAVVQRLRMAPPPRRSGERAPRRPEPLDAEDVLLAILLRYPGLRLAYRNYPESLFSSAVGREIFRRWVADPQTVTAAGDEVAEKAERLLRYRLPPLSEHEARRAADEKIQAILRERIRMHQAARAELLQEAEQQLGPNRIAELALRAWRGEIPPGEEREVAESLLEEFELGLSIHRRETPRSGHGVT
ncbi:DNA primase [Tepidiforma sp.]|uniref:DNA primase n=1 Tax=Tepidiforma sp. TaxID=2682230 RepID=UPI002ADDCD03|nr:DNA primase [Tepidiforma sp.]